MSIDKSLLNVIILGISFMLIFTAFQTMGNIEKTLISSISEDDENFTGKAYYSLAIIYLTLSICNWMSPSVISVIGPKFSMICGGVTYLLFIASFLIPKTWLLYFASVIIGIGAAMIWTGQGNFLTLNSTSSTISRNSGIFWALLQLRMCEDPRDLKILQNVALDADMRAYLIHLYSSSKNNMTLPLAKCCEYLNGLELGFFSGVYSSCIGFTENFSNRKELVGISGIFIGLGEVIGGALFGILGNKTSKWGRDPIVTSGFILHAISFFLIFLNLPNDSPFADTSSGAFIQNNAPLAIFCSFLLGFGDACYNTQIYSLLGGLYSDKSASAFAIFKFMQSIGAALCFVYAESLVLYGQLGILLVFAILGTLSFVWVEWTHKITTTVTDDESVDSSEHNK